MKVKLFILGLLTVYSSAFGQDTLSVSFSEETDSLAKQNFVDRYANVFMTKIPTQHMFKVLILDSRFAGLGGYSAYEYKISRVWSLEAGIYAQTSRINNSLFFELSRFKPENIRYWAIFKARWYFNMERRIQSGLNRNNFTGMYVGMSHEYLWKDGRSGGLPGHITGLSLGFKTRFLNHGYMDIGVSLYNRQLGLGTYRGERQGIFTPKHFILSTQKTFGIAFGDWKRNPSPPICDVLVCDEALRSQWKIGVPDISIGLLNQMATFSAAYEIKLGKTPLSVQAMNETTLFRFGDQSFWGQISTSLQLRYYILQSIKLKKGSGGSGFTGPYLAGSGEYFQSWDGKNTYPISNSHFSSNPVVNMGIGYQQRLFSKIFFDGSFFYRESYPGKKWKAAGAPSRIGAFSSKLAIGFTF